MSRMKLRTMLAVTITSLSILVTTVFAQQNTREIFERARMLDESNQNLPEAIKLYSQVVSQSNEQRALAARAQYRIGVLYERLGRKAEAQRAYQAVVKQYGDQSDVAGRARAKLPAPPKANLAAKPRSATEATTMTTRQVWAGADVQTEGTASPDGRYLSFMEKPSGNLAIRDLTTGESRRLTNDASGEEYCFACAYESIWSPDGKQIVYGWLTEENSKKFKAEALELRIIGINGSGKRVLYRPEGPIYAWPFDWSADGKYILAGLEEDTGPGKQRLRIAMISVADGTLRIVKTLNDWNWRLSKKMFLSADSRYIVYSVPVKEGPAARDIFLLSTDGTHEVPLIQNPADDRALGWLPSGNGILFASDRTGSKDLWTISVVDGKPQGTPQFIKRDIGTIEPLALTRSGALFYSVTTGLQEILSARLDAATGKLVSGPTPVSPRKTGVSGFARWSPDGRQLSYIISRWQGPPFGWESRLVPVSIVIREIESGEEREVTPELVEFLGNVWSPNGRSLTVVGKSKDDRQGIFRVDAQTGETKALSLSDPGERVVGWMTWAPDGNSIFYITRSNGKYSIVLRNLQSGEKKILYQPTADFINNLESSPDGKQLAFRWQRLTAALPHPAAIMVMPSSGGQPREVFRVNDGTLLQRRVSLTWSRNGQYVLFAMKPNKNTGKYDLWRVQGDGGTPKKLGLRMTDLADTTIHPDGEQIMFATGTRQQEVWVMENFLPKQNGKEQSRRIATGRR